MCTSDNRSSRKRTPLRSCLAPERPQTVRQSTDEALVLKTLSPKLKAQHVGAASFIEAGKVRVDLGKGATNSVRSFLPILITDATLEVYGGRLTHGIVMSFASGQRELHSASVKIQGKWRVYPFELAVERGEVTFGYKQGSSHRALKLVIAQLFIKGRSTHDIEAALEKLPGSLKTTYLGYFAGISSLLAESQLSPHAFPGQRRRPESDKTCKRGLISIEPVLPACCTLSGETSDARSSTEVCSVQRKQQATKQNENANSSRDGSCVSAQSSVHLFSRIDPARIVLDEPCGLQQTDARDRDRAASALTRRRRVKRSSRRASNCIGLPYWSFIRSGSQKTITHSGLLSRERTPNVCFR